MTKFRPCIDLHEGKVKQIVGESLRDQGPGPIENFVASEPPAWFANRFRNDELTGGHVIMLGSGNEAAAREALGAWPGGMQLGGGINVRNAAEWMDAGASHIIVTSWLFDNEGAFQIDRLKELAAEVGIDRVVLDLSARRVEEGWRVAMNRWQTPTDLLVTAEVLDRIAPYCAEFLIHAADVEGKCEGVDVELVSLLGSWNGSPVTYAGGVGGLHDLRMVEEASAGRVDVTVGSSLDLFGGQGIAYQDMLDWNEGGR
ncbi:MAG: phosphoribosylformimino-5-aminoimidazole carboxamide ribotide isomerase [Roseibacillus sp.]|nr:phosphoribosylformimino-5-aminoimidazole carboxamide ribotide isomerase [Roseibacillus sp.]